MSETIGTEEGELCNRGGCTGLIEIKWETNGPRLGHNLVCTECGASKAGTDWQEAQESTQHDPVNQPKHYMSLGAKCSCGKSIECIDVTENLGFNVGNAVKYCWRSEHKGKMVEDLEKAKWYIEREIERVKNG